MTDWQFWIDRGGTFTDIVAREPGGKLHSLKLLSDNPRFYSDAAVEGVRRILKRDSTQPAVSSLTIKMGTTVATNALLERKGEPTLLVISHGFGDALRIGYQNRPQLFSLAIELPEMLYQSVVEVDERIDAGGRVLKALNENEIRQALQAQFDKGLRSCAIVFMFGFRYNRHELRVAELAREVGFQQISMSHQCSPLMKLVSRGDTTVVDAYLSPILRHYVSRLEQELDDLDLDNRRLLFMQSSGGLTEAHHFAGKDAILSGPAGGVVGMVQTATEAGFDKLIGFDMGGTSTDVCHYAGEYERSFDTEVAGVRVRAPMMSIHTVAAGGGSILQFDGARFRVGPESAGADPGPAGYGNGGPLAVTDCNIMLGKIQPDYFPHVFGADGQQPLDVEAVNQRFEGLSRELFEHSGDHRSPQQIANGFLSIAVDNMANAIKKISVQRGYDVADYTLCCFGGAGAQHACLVADALGMKRVFLHPYAGVLSAYGMGLASINTILESSIEQPLNSALIPFLDEKSAGLFEQGRQELITQKVSSSRIQQRVSLHCYYQGSDTSLVVNYASLEAIRIDFEQAHRQAFGFVSINKTIMIKAIEVEVYAYEHDVISNDVSQSTGDLVPLSHHAVYMSSRNADFNAIDTPFYQRDRIPANQWIEGPAIILESNSTIVVEPGWRGSLTGEGNMIVERHLPLPQSFAVGTTVDPVMLEIFNNLFMSIAEQMGSVLEKTAVSVNIKERLDFSCAIFDDQGDLVANAPHMPVHLGSMSESIKTVIGEYQGQMHPGDAFVLNAPYNGGTHLPDVTIIRPVFGDKGDRVIFYVASRGHHADIGGIAPGSMPADSISVEQEGILLDNLRIMSHGELLENEIRELLSSGAFPARNIDMNIADFKAQLAACEKGMQELNTIVSDYGLSVVEAYMRHVQANAEESVRQVLDVLKDGEFCYAMDDGSRICVSIRVDRKGRCADIDFTGSSAQHAGNFNAPSAIARAAVLYVFRCLVNDQIPLNEGCLKPLNIILPEKSMIRPEFPAAVVAGNVETSQAIVDTLLGALGVCAASQGTMNNTSWGNQSYQYYETLCGGEGASDGHNGVSAVHTHMTNSRLTDPEVLEWRFPVMLDSFAIRKGSGGAGQYKGGDGVIRKTRFLEPMSVSLLTGHRQVPPYGLAGGADGQTGVNRVLRANGQVETLASCQSVDVEAGDTLIIETPGGGGYGKPASET